MDCKRKVVLVVGASSGIGRHDVAINYLFPVLRCMRDPLPVVFGLESPSSPLLALPGFQAARRPGHP